MHVRRDTRHVAVRILVHFGIWATGASSFTRNSYLVGQLCRYWAADLLLSDIG
jgi:hypothetical protein